MEKPEKAEKVLKNRRNGYSQEFRIDDVEFRIQTGEFDDGTLAEFFVNSPKEGTTEGGFMNALAIAISIGLQHGVPLEEYVRGLVRMKFPPSGMVWEHDRIRMGTSPVDVIMRELAISYLDRQDLANVPLDFVEGDDD